MLKSECEVLSHGNPKWNSLIISCLISLISVLFTQLTLFLLPQFLPTSSFLALLPLAALLIIVVVGLGRCLKKIAGVRASAPAFVFFSIFFIWAVYICLIRQVISTLSDIAINIEIILLIISLCGIMSLDPGFVRYRSSCHDPVIKSYLNEVGDDGESFTVHRRVRYCRQCKDYVLGFDHHCPAFGNCVGQKNHFFFVVLLAGFVISEMSYFACASQYIAKSKTFDEVGRERVVISIALVLGTMLFSLIQVVWQVIFIAWHVYCACSNIKTDEWINWTEYPEFVVEVVPHSGLPQTEMQFKNPYDKGILRNLKDFITTEG